MEVPVSESVYAFDEDWEELTWLASFLTANRELADVCLHDACNQCIQHDSAFSESPDRFARRAIIQSAFEMQQSRIAELWPIYLRRGCSHGRHASIAPEVLRLLTDQLPQALLNFDVLSRFALALRGVENYSAAESAIILGISREAFDAAYCAGLGAVSRLAHELLGVCEEGEEEDGN